MTVVSDSVIALFCICEIFIHHKDMLRVAFLIFLHSFTYMHKNRLLIGACTRYWVTKVIEMQSQEYYLMERELNTLKVPSSRLSSSVAVWQVREATLDLVRGAEVVVCGSYRRGKPTCGDVDVLITHPDGHSHELIFRPLLARLRDSGEQ